MIKTKYSRRLICIFTGIILVSGFWGCGQKPWKKPIGQESPVTKADKEAIALVPILMAEADKFASQKNYQDALLVYNQALGQTDAQGKEAIIAAIETVLIQTPTQVIEEFLQIKNLTIPQSLLQYWLGHNYAVNEDFDSARLALVLFLNTYPDHDRVEDARSLLSTIEGTGFNRETIGCLLPLSGKYKVYGQKALRGIQLAVQELSQRLGRPFRVIVKDTQSDPEHAATCVEELARENVTGIVGPLLSPDAAGKRAQDLKIPLMAMTQKSEFPAMGDYLFSNFITPEMQVQALGSYIFMELGLKKVAILYPKERYGKLYMELFWDVVDEYNGEVVGVESYDGQKTDFSLPLKKLTGEHFPVPEFLKPDVPEILEGLADGQAGFEDPSRDMEPADVKTSGRGSTTPNKERIEIDFQALFIPDALSRINLILPQLAFHDARGMVLLGTNLWHQDSLLTQAKGYNKNAVITDGYFGDSTNPVTAQFDKDFTELFEDSPGFLEAISYDTATTLFTAAMNEEVTSREGLKNALQNGQMFDGVTGQTVFDKTGRAHKELFLITVKRGKFLEINR